MQKSLKIIEWNLNCQSDKKVKIAGFIKDRIENEDIIIFTEIVKSDSVLQLIEYFNIHIICRTIQCNQLAQSIFIIIFICKL